MTAIPHEVVYRIEPDTGFWRAINIIETNVEILS